MGFFHRASSLLVVSSCHFFREGVVFQGLSPACLVGLLLVVKWDFSTRLFLLLLCAPVFLSLRSRAFYWPELLICLLSVAAIFCEAGPLSGPVVAWSACCFW